MFEGWQDFFLLAGSASAVLIGLIFVVISLMQDRSRASVLFGSKLYMGPIVLGVSFVLVLSAAALIPGIGRCAFAAVAVAIALWGLARGMMSIAGIRRRARSDDPAHWTDLWFYGLFPSLLYVALGLAAIALWSNWRWADDAVAVVVTAILALAVRNEWDLITWIAPRRGESEH